MGTGLTSIAEFRATGFPLSWQWRFSQPVSQTSFSNAVAQGVVSRAFEFSLSKGLVEVRDQVIGAFQAHRHPQ